MSHYNCGMSLSEQVQKDMIDAMRNKQELRLSTLRMVKAALKNKEIDNRAFGPRKTQLYSVYRIAAHSYITKLHC